MEHKTGVVNAYIYIFIQISTDQKYCFLLIAFIITLKLAHHTNPYNCMKLIMWNHRTRRQNKLERKKQIKSKTRHTNFENCTQNGQ